MNQPARLMSFLVLAFAPCAGYAECPVSLPADSPVNVPSGSRDRWYGSDALATQLPPGGRWRGLGAAHRYRDKTWFWRRGYDAESEMRPDLTISGMKVSEDGDPLRLNVEPATNAMGPGWEQMLVMVEFPSAGCWRLTAIYTHAGITQRLTFVVNVVD